MQGATMMRTQEQKEEYARKAKRIEELLSHPDEVDLWELRELCFTEGGLINDSIRKKAWPKLVGLSNTLKDPPPLPPMHRNRPRSKLPTRPKPKSMKPKPTPTKVTATPAGTSSRNTPASISVVDPTTVPSFKNQIMASCMDANQIALDIARCTWHLLNGSQRTRRNAMRNKHKKRVKALLKRKQKRLGNFINLTLIRSYGNEYSGSGSDGDGGNTTKNANDTLDLMDKLRYYQGYHDVSCVLLSALGGETRVPPQQASIDATNAKTVHEKAIKTAQAMGLDLPSEVLVQLSQSHFRDMMQNNFENLTKALKLVVMPLLAALDREVYQHLVDCDMEPYFCLSWIITWFSHDVRDTDLVKRLFDFFIASHPLMSIYVSVAMILHPYNRMEVLDADCDFACVHKALVDLPRNSCSVGWKFVGNVMGGGYVSGDDEEGVSLDGGSLLSQEVYREDCGASFDERSTASTVPSMSSDSILSNGESSRVPFQELIDLAITFMRRIPPRTLMRLAHRHYDSKTIQELASDADSITMLQPPPEWALSSTIESDKAIKRRLREMKIKGRGKVKGSEGEHNNMDSQVRKETDKNKGAPAQETLYPHAVIAAGIGPDGDGEILRRKRKRKLLRTGAIIFGIVAILCGLAERDILPVAHIFGNNNAIMIPRDMVVSGRGVAESESVPLSTRSIISELEKFEITGEMDIIQHILEEDEKDQSEESLSLADDAVDEDEDEDEYDDTEDPSSGHGSDEIDAPVINHEEIIQNIDEVMKHPAKEERTEESQQGAKIGTHQTKPSQKLEENETAMKLQLISNHPSVATDLYPVETGSISYLMKYVESFLTQMNSLESSIQETREELEVMSTKSLAIQPTNVFKPGEFAKKIMDEVKIALNPEAEAIFL